MPRPGTGSPPGCVPAGSLYLHDEQHIQALEEDRVHGEEVACQQSLRLGAQEPPPRGVQASGSGPDAPGAEDPPDSRLTDLVAKTGQLAMHPAVAPRGVLHRQPQYQVADLLASRPTA